MKKNNKKLNVNLIVIDLDHTLIGFGLNKLELLNRQAIKFAKEKGKEIIIATGRSFTRSIEYSKQLELNYHICFGGALLYSLKEKKVLYFVKIDDKQLEAPYQSTLFLNPALFTTFYCYNETSGRIDSFYLGKTNKAFSKHNIDLKEFKAISHTKELLGKTIVRMNVFGEESELDNVKRELDNTTTLNIIKNYETVLEITDVSVNKGTTLKILIKKLGIDKKNIMAFGDSYNDLSLFEVAKYGIAVQNSVKELKDKSYLVAEAYDQQGVGKAMFELLDLN